jgi:hypothetical protein
MFEFLVLAAWLEKAESRGLQLDLLTIIRDKFFSDPDGVEPGVAFQDPHALVHGMFGGLARVLAPPNGVVVSGDLATVKGHLASLRGDPVIREELEPLYKVFLREMANSPRRKLQNCILSIL